MHHDCRFNCPERAFFSKLSLGKKLSPLELIFVFFTTLKGVLKRVARNRKPSLKVTAHRAPNLSASRLIYV